MASGRRKIAKVAGGLSASLLAHVLLLALVARAPLRPSTARSRLASIELEIDQTVPTAARLRASSETLRAPADLAVPRRAPARVPEHDAIAQPAAAVPHEASEPSAPAEALVVQPTDVEPPRPPAPPSAAPIVLSARAVANAAFSNAQTRPDPSALGPSHDDDLLQHKLSAELTAGLRAELSALRAPTKRPPPELQRAADGTCHYAGTAIDATILPDGGVQFVEKASQLTRQYGVAQPPERPTRPEDLVAPQQLQFSVKSNPPAVDAERSWFLRETEAVRRELADAARDREEPRNVTRLRRELDEIWCDATRPLPQRRRELFEVWNRTSPDAVGERGRQLVVEYVREHAPEHSQLAFTAQELAALNAHREPRARFEPYASAL